MPERPPEPRRLDEQLDAAARARTRVAGRGDVAAHRVGDVGVDVERRRAGRPVPRALLAADRAPRERRPAEPQLARPRPRQGERRVAPAQRVARGARARCRSAPAACRSPCPRTCGRRSRGRSAPWPGSRAARPGRRPAPPGTARTAPPAAARVALHLDVGAGSRTSSRYARWPAHEPLPAGPLRRRERGVDLVAQRRHRALARPAVREQLDDRQPLPGRELGADRDPRQVRLALGARSRSRPARRRRGRSPAAIRSPLTRVSVPERRLEVVVRVILADERGAQRGGSARVVGLLGHGLVGDERRTARRCGPAVARPRPRSRSPPPRAGRTRPAGSTRDADAPDRPARPTRTSRRSTPSRRSSTRSWRSSVP